MGEIEYIIVRISAASAAENQKEPTAILEGNLTLPHNNNNRNPMKGIFYLLMEVEVAVIVQGINLFLRLSIMMVLPPC